MKKDTEASHGYLRCALVLAVVVGLQKMDIFLWKSK